MSFEVVTLNLLNLAPTPTRTEAPEPGFQQMLEHSRGRGEPPPGMAAPPGHLHGPRVKEANSKEPNAQEDTPDLPPTEAEATASTVSDDAVAHQPDEVDDSNSTPATDSAMGLALALATVAVPLVPLAVTETATPVSAPSSADADPAAGPVAIGPDLARSIPTPSIDATSAETLLVATTPKQEAGQTVDPTVVAALNPVEMSSQSEDVKVIASSPDLSVQAASDAPEAIVTKAPEAVEPAILDQKAVDPKAVPARPAETGLMNQIVEPVASATPATASAQPIKESDAPQAQPSIAAASATPIASSAEPKTELKAPGIARRTTVQAQAANEAMTVVAPAASSDAMLDSETFDSSSSQSDEPEVAVPVTERQVDTPQVQAPDSGPAPVTRAATVAPAPRRNLAIDGPGIASRVADRIEALALERRSGSVTIRLAPKELGDITLTVRNLGGSLSVEANASHDGVRDALKANAHGLIRQVESKGFSMGSFDVGQQSTQQNPSNLPQQQTQDQPQAAGPSVRFGTFTEAAPETRGFEHRRDANALVDVMI